MRQLYSVFNKTPTLCFYRYQNSYPLRGVFPHVQTLSLIHCTQITSLLQSSVFPNLRTIHYLSAPPKELIPDALHFKWVFPSLVHPFYSGMMEAGIGRIDETLITTYVDSMIPAEDGLVDAVNPFSNLCGVWDRYAAVISMFISIQYAVIIVM